MKRYVIAKSLRSGKYVYYNSREKKFDSITFSSFESLGAVSMLLITLVRNGELNNVENTDVTIREITLWPTKSDKE